MVVDARTSNLNLPKNSPSNTLKDDMTRAIAAMDGIDTAIAVLQTSVAAKASLGHVHTISEVTGLQSALDGKAATSHSHALGSLTDVNTSGASAGMVLVRGASTWQAGAISITNVGGLSDYGRSFVAQTSAANARAALELGSAALESSRYLTTGTPLPGSNVGPIWHDDYNSWMTWQAFTANGAAYTGYASVDVGSLLLDTQPTPRTGYIASGTINLSKTAYAALYNWGKHNGRFVALGSWVAGPLLMTDNADGATFRVFDVRGEFLRAWDNGRGADSGRGFGTWQDSTNKAHSHSVYDPGHTHGIDYNQNGVAPGGYGYTHVGGGWGITYPITTNGTGIGIYNSGDAEARSRNTALLATVKF